MSTNMRGQMPATAAFIDSLRAAFGADQVDPSIRRAMAGEPGFFHAKEGGRELGTAWDSSGGTRPCFVKEIRGE